MSFKYTSLAVALLIVGILAGTLAGSNLMPNYVTLTTTKTKVVTTTSSVTKTTTSTKYFTVTTKQIETTTKTKTVTETEVKEVTKTLTATKYETRTVTSTVTHTRTVTSVTTATETVTTTTTVKPLSITRSFDIHLIINDTWARVAVEIPQTYIEKYLGRRVAVYVRQEAQVLKKLIEEGASQPPIYNLAMELWMLAGGDPELFTAYALEALHQMNYNFSKAYLEYGGVQPPLTTLIENSGVCMDYVLLYASILKAANVSTAIVFVKVWSSQYNIINQSHAMLAVKLPTQPKLPQEYHLYFIKQGYPSAASLTIEGEIYYLADPTPSVCIYIIEPQGKPQPPARYYPAFVGEYMWDKIEIRKVIKIS